MAPSDEERTRKDRIDPRLRNSGWKVVLFDPATSLDDLDSCAIEEYPTSAGPADYALCVDGRIVGVLEGKKTRRGPMSVLSQAARYSKALRGGGFNFRGYRVPFLYASNGEVIWHHDVREAANRSREIAAFHTPSALREQLMRDFDGSLATLESLPFHPRLRPYQIEANEAIDRAMAARKRRMLLAMATGTGKTFTLVSEAYRLMKSGAAQRVLWLVDRRVLAVQAVRAFAALEAEPGLKFDKVYEVYSQRFFKEDVEDEPFDPNVLPSNYLTDPSPGDAFVYVSTIQRMARNLFGETGAGDDEHDAAQLDIPIHAFDLVIADECHRGYTSQVEALWRRTIDHFDGVKVGLTATPASHTTGYFSEVAYRYEYERAVREGYLVDYDVVAVKSGVRMNGVFLETGERVQVVDPETGLKRLDVLEDERQFPSEAIESAITVPETNRKILEEVKRAADQHEVDTGRFPKILIFADNDVEHTSHADALVDIARDLFGRGDEFVAKITGTVDRPLKRIREFRNRPEHGIAVTVDLLTTGVDIPDLEFLVFLRPVYSRILFEQMLGRGTRLGEQYPDKSNFVVFDCFDGTLIEYFRDATAITTDPVAGVTRKFKEIADDIWAGRDRDYNVRCAVKRLRRVARQMGGVAREEFSAFVPDGDVARFAEDLPTLLNATYAETIAILRDPAFHDLLENFTRPPRSFLIAQEATDEVSSEWKVRGADGKEYKPEDYLAAFADYVRANKASLGALKVLLSAPRSWNPRALVELQEAFESQPQRFTVRNLQQAHRHAHDKALVDIISMVRHAANASDPLLSPDERVAQAMARVRFGRTFTEEQSKWLDRIHDHLRENLSIDEQDFDALPVFLWAGGWRRADEAFDGALSELLEDINEAVAA